MRETWKHKLARHVALISGVLVVALMLAKWATPFFFMDRLFDLAILGVAVAGVHFGRRLGQ